MNLIQTYKLLQHDETSNILEANGIFSKNDVHAKDLLHKSVHLLVICDNEVLCRYRTRDEERYPGVYTTTVGTHVLIDHDYFDTLEKYLKPDLDLKFEWVGEFFVHDAFENEINGLFVTRTTNELLPTAFLKNKNFFQIDNLNILIRKQKTTPHLAEALKLLSHIFFKK